MSHVSEIRKPSNAGWVAKVTVTPAGEFGIAEAPAGTDHQLGRVEVAWYDDDRIKVTLKWGGPALIRQTYLSGSGQDVILDIVKAPAE